MRKKVGRLQKHYWNKKRGESKRPWRLLGTLPDGTAGNILWRAFSTEIKAHNAALIDVRWGDFRTIEVYDVRNGKESGTYAMKPGTPISFTAPEDSSIVRLLRKKGVISA